MRRVVTGLVVACTIGWTGIVCAQTTQGAGERPAYKDAGRAVDERIDDLLGRMTVEEKIAQLRGIWQFASKITDKNVFNPDKAAPLLAQGIGEVGPVRWDIVKEIAFKNAVQKYLMEQTRLGIPAIFHDEGCHGVLAEGASSFPAPIGLACSWDAELVERVFTVVAAEMRARGSQHALTPVVDICREPRWGRTDETMGEDPYLNGKLGSAMVLGLQGRPAGTVSEGHVVATLKHMVGHGAPEGGINRAPGNISTRALYESHLLPFRIAIAESGPLTVMPSYNEIDGVPSHANRWLLQDVLRKEFGFTGLIASDYTGVEYLYRVHAVAADQAEAALKAFRAGVDLNLPRGDAYTSLKALVDDGRLKAGELDEPVRRVLRLKFVLGLFENPYADAQKAIEIVKRESTRELAREAARKSIVLLKNNNDILPLDRAKYRKIAVIGPNAAEARLGSYSGEPLYKVTLLEGIRAKAGKDVEIKYAEGCKIVRKLPASSMQAWNSNALELPSAEENRKLIDEALGVARESDLIILALGENEMINRESWDKHMGDRETIELFGSQQELADAVLALGKPVVVYLMNGRPIAMPALAQKADAMLEGWYMGQETGTAAAEILFGDINPSGKLTISFPRSTGHIPTYYNYKPGSKLFNYITSPSDALFPFGFGLSYTKFVYGDPQLSAGRMARGGQAQAQVTVKVTNSGSRKGDEIVQMYIRDKVSSVTRPIKELRGFQRITLEPGESREVTFTITPQSLAFYDIDMKYVVEPGEFEVMVGPSSAEVKKVALVVE